MREDMAKGKEPAGSGCGSATRGLLQEKESSLKASLCFLVVCIILKIFTTILGGSLTQVTDLFRSISEALAVGFSFISLRKTSRGRDDIHQFGYGKLESLAGIIVVAVILITVLVVIFGMVIRLQNPPAVGMVGYGLILAIFSFFVDFYFWRRNYQISLKEHSPLMESNWRLFRSKAAVNVLVVMTLALSLLFRNNSGVIYIDIIGTVAVAGYMLFTAYRLLTSSVYELIDGTLDESLQIIILRELAGYFPEYEQFHGWRCRRSGTEVYIDIFLEFEPSRTMGDIQTVINRMRASMESAISNSHVCIIPATSVMK
jgi:cation diffusion facilitator family transporter